jgi:hypothetical protein
MQYNVNGEGTHIASGLGPFGCSARYNTRRKIGLRLGERDVKGGEDDWEGEGELEHVCLFVELMFERCGAFRPLRRVLFILSSLVSMRSLSEKCHSSCEGIRNYECSEHNLSQFTYLPHLLVVVEHLMKLR